MSVAEALKKTRSLTLAQRRELAEILISETEGADELPPKLRVELDRRAQEAFANPERCRPWTQIRRELRKKPGNGK